MDPDREKLVGPERREPALPSTSETLHSRESIRRNFLRANTAVAIVLLAVFGLALVAVLASLQARRHQRLAEQAQAAARTELWHTYLSKAHAARLGSALDRRRESLQAITNAAAIHPSADLRSEAIATLALNDFALEQSWALSEGVTSDAFDRDLQQYAIGWTNGDIALHRISDNQIVQWLRQANGEIPSTQGAPIGLEFSPDNKSLAARYERGGLLVWELATAKVTLRHALDRPRSPLSRPRFSSDSRFLIAMTTIPKEGVAVFDLANGKITAHLPQFKSWMHAAPRPGSTMLSVTSETNLVHILDWRSGQNIISLPFPGGVERMTWSPDGKYLAIGGKIPDVHLWDIDTALAQGALGQKRVLTGHTADVRNLVFDPSGERLASASGDGTSRIWETRSGRLLGVTDRGFAQQFAQGGRLALTRFKGAVEVWSLRPSPVHSLTAGIGGAENSPWAMDLSPDGRWLASLVIDRGLVMWDLDRGTTPGWFEIPDVRLLTFHPSEPMLFITSSNAIVSHKLATLTNATTPARLMDSSLALPPNFSPHWIALSRDARTMAIGSYFGEQTFAGDLTLKNLVLLKGLRHLTRFEVESPTASATGGGSLALSGDGRRVACGFVYPRGTKVWDAHSGEQLTTLSTDNAIVQFSPDDRWIAAGTRSHYQLFNATDWREVWRVPRDGALYSAGPCAFSPDGRQVAIAKSRQTAAILDANTGRELTQLISPRLATIKALRWSPDGRRLVVGTAENFVQVWELGALRSELASLGMPWDSATAFAALGVASINSAPPGNPTSPTAWALVLGLLAAGLITMVALMALRRHRQLIEAFAHTEALAGKRERELQVEREVGQLKSSFVSLVSHEFRTPLGVITASAGNLQRYFSRLSDDDRRNLLGDIINSSSRMRDLIEEVLLLGKVDSGKMKCERASIDLPALCRRTIAEVTAASGAGSSIDFASEGVNGQLQLDETLTGIILVNLLNNAVKYSPPGKTVRLSVRFQGKDAIIEVQDQGIGIPAGDQKELFKSFHRGSNVGNLPGTGLGLTIVKRCVDLHQGQISLTSVENRGTTFTVSLPTEAPSAAA